MLNAIESWYKILKENGRAPENYRRLLLDSLVAGPNHQFNNTACRSKYNNMSKKKQWNQVDPRDTQILALTTQV